MATLITGASSGIGEEFAYRYAAQKHDLILVARTESKLETLAQKLRTEYGVTVTVFPCDLAAPDAAERLWEETNHAGLEVDVLVNNAGFGTQRDVADDDPDRLEQEVRLNCLAVVGLTARYLPASDALWAETRKDGIRVLAVCPGSTDTPFFDSGEGVVVGKLRSTRQLLDNTMRALKTNKPSFVDGLGNAIVARFAVRIVPKRIILAATERVFRIK